MFSNELEALATPMQIVANSLPAHDQIDLHGLPDPMILQRSR